MTCGISVSAIIDMLHVPPVMIYVRSYQSNKPHKPVPICNKLITKNNAVNYIHVHM